MPTIIEKRGTTMGGEASSPTNPDKGCARKRKKNSDSLNDALDSA